MSAGAGRGGSRAAIASVDRDDATLRAEFVELHRAEEAGAPSFSRLLARRELEPSVTARVSRLRPRTAPQSGGLRVPLPRLVAAAAVVAAAGIGVWLGRTSGETQPPVPHGREAVWLSTWESPTDFLLDTPGVELLRTTPDIRESSTSVTSITTSTSAKGATP